MLLAIFTSCWTSIVGSMWIFGSISGGFFGGTICVSANFGGVPFVTGVGPRCPPPPPSQPLLAEPVEVPQAP